MKGSLYILPVVILASAVSASAPECPAPGRLPFTVQLPDPSDCSRFYKCDNGEKVLFQCPGGLNYNELLQVCDWPANVDCSRNSSSPDPPPRPSPPSPPTTEASTEAPTEPITNAPTEPITNAPTEAPTTAAPSPPVTGPSGLCPYPDPIYAVILPHEEDPKKFYICSFGIAYEKQCPSDLYFNPELSVCG